MTLQIERIRTRVKARELAVQMGISPGRLSRIEHADSLTLHMTERYRNALAALTPVEEAA